MTKAGTALLAVLAGVSTAVAQPVPPGGFRYERDVVVTAPGPQRLDLDAILIAGARTVITEPVTTTDGRVLAYPPQDFRLYTAAGVEVPYLLVGSSRETHTMLNGQVLPLATTEKTSGFEVDFRAIVPALDAVAVRLPPPFLKRFRLEGSGDRERWTVLVAEGTMFDLPDEKLQHIKVEFEPGAYRYVRVTWDDTNSARIRPPSSITGFNRSEPSIGSPLRLPLPFERRPSEPGRSRFRVTLPHLGHAALALGTTLGAHLPIRALEFTIGGSRVRRDVRVLENIFVRAGADEPSMGPLKTGEARLSRIQRDGATAEALRVEIRFPRQPELDLVFDDGDNPPVDLQGVTAVFAELPWIYFESQPGTLVARFGHPTVEMPHYDLEAARGTIAAITPNRAAWGPEPPRTAAAAAAPGLPMPTRGAPLKADTFRYVRAIPTGPPGLVTVPLDAAALAHSARHGRSIRDVRVLDGNDLQVPYLIEEHDEPLTVDVPLERMTLPPSRNRDRASVSNDTRISTYSLTIPDAGPALEVLLTTRARVFRRGVRVGVFHPADGRRDADVEIVSTHLWTQADDATAAPPLRLPVRKSIDRKIVLQIEEGDNQPLPIERATLLLPNYAVRFLRTDSGPLRLAYGRSDLSAPQYDLQLLAPQLLGQPATEVRADSERGPDGKPVADAGPPRPLVSPAVFWAVLGVAVVVLLGVVARLVRRET